MLRVHYFWHQSNIQDTSTIYELRSTPCHAMHINVQRLHVLWHDDEVIYPFSADRYIYYIKCRLVTLIQFFFVIC